MNTYTTAAIGLLTVLSWQTAVSAQEPKTGTTTLASSDLDVLAEVYEHLADSIIKIRATEDNLVKGLLVQYHATAQRHLADASEKNGERKAHMEAAAANIADIANEGDKRVRAVRQRLSEAGHYHQKDTVTAEDYMFINATEKKSLFALAKKVGQMGADGAPGDIKKVSEELKTLFSKAIGRE